MEQQATNQAADNKNTLAILAVTTLVIFLMIVAGLYLWVSKKSKGQVVFPAGINYTGNEATAPQKAAPAPQYDFEKLAASTDWATFTSPKSQYTFQYPKGMLPLIFPGDVNDSATFDIGGVPAQYNLLTLVESISNYDPKLTGRQEEFIRNYWRFFSGLKGLQSIEPYKNEKGLNGFKVQYITKTNATTADYYFFLDPNNQDKVLHVGNIFPPEGQTVFLRLLNSLEWKR